MILGRRWLGLVALGIVACGQSAPPPVPAPARLVAANMWTSATSFAVEGLPAVAVAPCHIENIPYPGQPTRVVVTTDSQVIYDGTPPDNGLGPTVVIAQGNAYPQPTRAHGAPLFSPECAVYGHHRPTASP